MTMIKLAAATISAVILLTVPASARHHYSGYYYYHPQKGWLLETGKKHTRYVRAKRHVRHARSHRSRTAKAKTPPWNMVKVKTVQGLTLTVHPAYAHKFLRFFEILDQNHIKVPKDMVGCYARGGHVGGSNHYIGAACDIQTGWNKTLPAMYHAGKWIRQAGLYDGCDFGDCGHIEGVKGTHNAKKIPNLYAAMAIFKRDESTAAYEP